MTIEQPGAGALDYFPCQYGRSKLLFRGPRRQLKGDYCVAVGGTETYGKFVEHPYPSLLEGSLGLPVVNFGCVNAGIDLFCSDAGVIDACARAQVTVLQLVGAQNMSNRFYAVHPRRNDRFLRASVLMKSLFSDVDFTEIHFTRHLLSVLRDAAPDNFALVADELKSAWVARMRHLMQRIGGHVILLWLQRPQGPGSGGRGADQEPLLIDADMVRAIQSFSAGLVTVTPSSAARAAGTTGMIFADFDQAAASGMPGPMVHAEVAQALRPVMQLFLPV